MGFLCTEFRVRRKIDAEYLIIAVCKDGNADKQKSFTTDPIRTASFYKRPKRALSQRAQ